MRISVVFGCAVISLLPAALGADIPVGPGQSIQAAINLAQPGDRVLVAAGVYAETLEFQAKTIEVIGVAGPAVTIVDASGLGNSVVRFVSGSASIVRGLTLTGGNSPGNGGGVRCLSAVATLIDCVIRGNGAAGHGGGIYVNAPVGGTAPGLLVEGCLIAHNTAVGDAGGVFVANATWTLRKTRIEHNTAGAAGGGIAAYRGGSALECMIVANQANGDGGGIAAFDYDVIVERSVVTDNEAARGGGAHVQFTYSGPSFLPKVVALLSCVLARNHALVTGGAVHSEIAHTGSAAPFVGVRVHLSGCTIADNTAVSPGAPALHHTNLGFGFCALTDTIVWRHALPAIAFNSNLSAVACNIEGGFAGALNADPLFVDPLAGDYHIHFGSPCIGLATGSTTHDFEGDPRGPVSDIGADEFHPHVWVVGRPSPGHVAVLRIAGNPGDSVWMLATAAVASKPTPTAFGPFLLEPPLSFGFPALLPPIPANGVHSFPVLIPSGVALGDVALQALVGTTLTNAAVVHVE